MSSQKPTYEELLRENQTLKKELERVNNHTEPGSIWSCDFRELVIESSLMPIVILDPTTYKVLDCNNAAVCIYHYSSKEEVLGRTPMDFSYPTQYDGSSSEELVKEKNQLAIDTGSVVFEWLHQYPDGELWDAEVHLRRFTADGKTYLQYSIIDITDRIRSKEALRQSEVNLKSLIENSLDSIWSIDTDYTIQYVNRHFVDNFKHSFGVELTRGAKILETLPKPLSDIWKERYDRALNNEHFSFTDVVETEIGSFYVEVSMMPIEIDNVVVGVAIYSRDITTSKRYEIGLEESNAMRTLIMDSIPSFIFWKDRQSVYLGCNQKFAEAAGVSCPEEIIGKTDFDLAWEREEAEFFVQKDKEVMDGGKALYHIVEPQSQADGQRKWLETNKIPLVDADGEVFGILGTYEDVTHRKLMEKALTDSEKKFKETVNLLPQVVFEMDTSGRLTFVNKQAQYTFGYDDDDIKKGLSVYDCVAPEYHENIHTNLPKIYSGISSNNEYLGITKDGHKFPIIISSAPIFDGEKIMGLRGIIVDITTRKENENELIRAKEKAEESDRLKSLFLANMSHEIRTPMNGILGFAELLKTPDLSGDEQSSFIDIIEKSGHRMLNIINDLINISKIDSQQMEVSMCETDINEQFQFLHSFFMSEASQKGIDLRAVCTEDGELAKITTDKEKVYAILTNLIKNAIKFTEQGYVEFGYKMSGNTIDFYVKDTGIGIPKSKQELVFDRFVQADLSVTNCYEGSGLGLSISKGYIELLKGKVWLESEEGKGSCFYFSLPIA